MRVDVGRGVCSLSVGCVLCVLPQTFLTFLFLPFSRCPPPPLLRVSHVSFFFLLPGVRHLCPTHVSTFPPSLLFPRRLPFPPLRRPARAILHSFLPSTDAAHALRYQQLLVDVQLTAVERGHIRNLGETRARDVMRNKWVPIQVFREKPLEYMPEENCHFTLASGAFVQIDKNKPGAITSQADFVERLSHFVQLALRLHPVSHPSNFGGLRRVVIELLPLYDWKFVLNFVEAVRRLRSGSARGFGGEVDLATSELYRVHITDPTRKAELTSRPARSAHASPRVVLKRNRDAMDDSLSDREIASCRRSSACIAFNKPEGCKQSGDHEFTPKSNKNATPLKLIHKCGLCDATDHGIALCPRR